MTATAAQPILCTCGCNDPVTDPTRSQYAHGRSCADRAYRARVKDRARAAGLPARLSLRVVPSLDPAQMRLNNGTNVSATASRPRESLCRNGVQIYIRDVAVARRVRNVLEQAQRETVDDAQLAAAVTAVKRGLFLQRHRPSNRAARATRPSAAAAAGVIPCPSCRGSGTCATCHGEGRVPSSQRGVA